MCFGVTTNFLWHHSWPAREGLVVRQVYAWIVDEDARLLLQMPGGTPEDVDSDWRAGDAGARGTGGGRRHLPPELVATTGPAPAAKASRGMRPSGSLRHALGGGAARQGGIEARPQCCGQAKKTVIDGTTGDSAAPGYPFPGQVHQSAADGREAGTRLVAGRGYTSCITGVLATLSPWATGAAAVKPCAHMPVKAELVGSGGAVGGLRPASSAAGAHRYRRAGVRSHRDSVLLPLTLSWSPPFGGRRRVDQPGGRRSRCDGWAGCRPRSTTRSWTASPKSACCSHPPRRRSSGAPENFEKLSGA